MRYPNGSGLTDEGRARRRKVRLQAAYTFRQGMDPVQVARLLRVSTESAYQWRRFWRGRRGGPGGERPGPERGPGSGASSTGPAGKNKARHRRSQHARRSLLQSVLQER